MRSFSDVRMRDRIQQGWPFSDTERPAIPAHQVKFGGEYAVTPEWKIGTDVAVVGSQYFVGDDSNLNAKVPAYWVANLRSSYQFTREVQVFGIVTNLFNQKYYTYGTYFELDGVARAISTVFTDPRTVTPAQPLAVYGRAIRLAPSREAIG